MLIPNVLAITFDGIDFVSSTGGVVSFGSSFVASRFSWVNGLNSFNGLRWAGANRGILGFDAANGVNMSITQITKNTITYNVTTLNVGASTTRVRYGDKGRPTSTGALFISFDATTDITTIATTGNKTVVLTWPSLDPTTIRSGLNIMIFMIPIVFFVILLQAGGGNEIRNTLLSYGLIIAALAIMIQAILNLGV